MSTTPQMKAMMEGYGTEKTASQGTAPQKDTVRRIVAGLGMIVPVSAILALAAWYIAF